MAFLVYYTLRDGSEYVAWLWSLTPLPPPATDRLFTKIDRTTWGVIIGLWGPAALYLIVIDEVTAGITLALYGLFIVNMIDNYLRPIVTAVSSTATLGGSGASSSTRRTPTETPPNEIDRRQILQARQRFHGVIPPPNEVAS